MFIDELQKVINTGQARVIILTGNIHDLFYDGEKYVPLLEYLSAKCTSESTGKRRGITQLLYKLNNPIECRGDRDELCAVWRSSGNTTLLTDRFGESNRNTTFALELMRQLTEANRSKVSKNNLLIMLEAADMIIPQEEISRMSLADRHRVGILNDWFGDPRFMEGGDTVILLAESRSQIHNRISRLPQVVSIEVPLPDQKQRHDYIVDCLTNVDVAPWHVCNAIAEQSSGLSIHALRQFLKGEDHSLKALTAKVEEYMVSQVGEGVIEFSRPSHTLKEVVGFSTVKKFMEKELIPGFLNGSIGGAAVGGPIGGGKTFICEAVAAELGIPVIILKNIRSKWYGETDAIFERLKRLLETFHRIMIFVDEADTQFGSVSDGHATERRLTGKVQGMMSDPRLKGKVIWFLMTARIHLLSPDIRRPGRMDLIIPILDPKGKDREEFTRWCFDSIEFEGDINEETGVWEVTKGYSAAAFAMLRSRIKAEGCDLEAAMAIAEDMILPDIEETRRYQSLQARLNCTRLSLLDMKRGDLESNRKQWKQSIIALEAQGIR